jgi:hypothetical protein
MDSYWAGLADFLVSAPEGVSVSLAPRGVAEAIPGLMSFEEWDHFQMISRVIVHKGLVNEIPNGLLEGLFGTAHPSFANEVFVVYDITPTRDEHVRAAELALAEKTVSETKRLKALEDENSKLKKLLADAMVDNAMLKEIGAKKCARREADRSGHRTVG